jgi:hypothetical protein
MKQMDGRAVAMKLVVDGVQRVGPPIVVRIDEPASTPTPIEAAESPVEQPPTLSDVTLSDTAPK